MLNAPADGALRTHHSFVSDAMISQGCARLSAARLSYLPNRRPSFKLENCAGAGTNRSGPALKFTQESAS